MRGIMISNIFRYSSRQIKNYNCLNKFAFYYLQNIIETKTEQATQPKYQIVVRY